jgi:hypothetical protein
MRTAYLMALALLLTACGSEEPPAQTKDETPSLSGTATYDGTFSSSGATAKGVGGPPRTSSNSTATSQYSVSVLELTAPYVLRWNGVDARGQQVFLYSVATRAGVANITPLTTLVVAQLLGQDPETAFDAFGATGGVQSSLVTDANIQDAQAKVIAYLQDVLGVQVGAGIGNFVTSTFRAAAGDSMFDTMQAIDAKLVADGVDFGTLSGRIATLARLCIEESIQITVGGQQKQFCPASKTANREEADNTIIDYVFTSPTRDSLTVKVQSEAVLSGEYVSTAGEHYSCTGAGCGITLGTPAADLTRALDFGLTQLAGGTGTAVLNGSLQTAIPGVELPILPCDNNKYYVILQDRTVYADCVDANDPLSLGGTLAELHGEEVSRAAYRFVNGSSTNPAHPQVEVVTDGNDSLVSVAFTLFDEQFFPTVHYACMRSACNGVTLGPVTVNTDLDPSLPVLVRKVTFDNTALAGLTPEGAATSTSATLKASFTTVYFRDPSTPQLFAPQADCASSSDTTTVAVMSGSFNYCSDPTAREAGVIPDSTDVNLRMTDDSFFTPIEIRLDGDQVVSVIYSSPVSQRFLCTTNCTGVTISAPDPNGARTVTFTNTVLYEEQSFPVPGERTATLNSGALAFPAP